VVSRQQTSPKIIIQSPSLKKNTPETKLQPQIKSRKFNCTPKTDEQYETLEKQLDSYLLQSTTPEVKLLLAITGFDPDKQTGISGETLSNEDRKQRDDNRINKLALSMADFPDNKLLSLTLMNACIANPDNLNCSSSYIDNALRFDGDNGALLNKIAAYYNKKGDKEAAISFLESSANAPFFNNYRKERILLFINALKPTGWSLEDIVVAALGFESAIWIGDLSIVTGICLSESLTDNVIQTCLAYGKRLESDGDTLLYNYIGLNIQKKIYKHFADNFSLEEVARKKKALDQFAKDIAFTEQFFPDENFVNDWITSITNFNEKDTFRHMKEEADRLIADPDYTPCPTD